MKVLALAFVLCFLAAPDSCDSKQGRRVDLSAGMVPKASINQRRQCSADHRFVNMSDLPITVRGDVALDLLWAPLQDVGVGRLAKRSAEQLSSSSTMLRPGKRSRTIVS